MPEVVAVPAILLLILSLLLWTDWLWDLDQQVYDWHIQLSAREPPRDIVIVAIDEQSMAALGRWPWSRSVHADLVRRIDAAGAKVIGLDILFAEADRTDFESDRRLSEAIRQSGKVVLPVANEQQRLGGALLELLPLSELVRAAARLGHVDRQLDRDAISRTAYLKAGLGSPRWPSFALAMLQVGEERSIPLVGLRNPDPDPSPMAWTRDYQIWMPYAGPPGQYPRVSVIDVLRDTVSPEHFRDAYVLIGATAAGLGDLLPTPVSGDRHPMPGVEIVANELDILRQGIAILPVPGPLGWLLAALLVLIPTTLYPFVPRWSLYVWAGCLGLSVLVSFLLLRTMGLWWAPVSVLAVQLLSYPLWSWRRLVQTLRYLNEALERLHAEPSVTDRPTSADLSHSFEFLSHVLPIRGAALIAEDGRVQHQWGLAPGGLPNPRPASGSWAEHPPAIWTRINRPEETGLLGLTLNEGAILDQTLIERLEPVVQSLQGPTPEPGGSAVELMQIRIRQVRIATQRLQDMRHFVDETLSHMAYGVLVADVLGTVVLANRQVTHILGGDGAEASLIGQDLLTALGGLQTQGGLSCQQAVELAWVERRSAQMSARTPEGRDLMVQISAFAYTPVLNRGLLVSLADVTELKTSERRRRELMAFLSHDLRSPLSSILAVTGLARLRPERVEDPDFVDRIEEHARKTLDLADAFLELARAQSADWRDFSIVDLAAVVHEAADSVTDQALAKQIVLTRSVPDTATMRGERALLERAMINLLNNAIKYSSEGQRVDVELALNQQEIRCAVRDTGHGIPEQALPSLFEKYQRVPDPRHASQRGSGLGLAFVKAVVERHRGRVTVESEPGRGSCFTLVFPLL